MIVVKRKPLEEILSLLSPERQCEAGFLDTTPCKERGGTVDIVLSKI
ncbi:MAG: hypothetical protein AB2L14_14855 [Candidatus Xenobiia bacterium LiM19]